MSGYTTSATFWAHPLLKPMFNHSLPTFDTHPLSRFPHPPNNTSANHKLKGPNNVWPHLGPTTTMAPNDARTRQCDKGMMWQEQHDEAHPFHPFIGDFLSLLTIVASPPPPIFCMGVFSFSLLLLPHSPCFVWGRFILFLFHSHFPPLCVLRGGFI